MSTPLVRQTGDERFQTDRVMTISVGHAVHDTYTAFLPPLLPAFIEKLLLSKTEAGLLAVFLQGPSLLQPAIGHLADRVNLRYVVILAPAVSAVMMSLLGVAPVYAALTLLLLVAGLSSACFHAVAPVVAGTLSGRSLGRGMGFWMLGGELGRTLGPIVAVTTVGLVTLQGLPWLMPFGLLASVVLFLRLRDTPVRPRCAGAGLPWRSVLRRMRPILFPLTGIIATRALILSALIIFLPTFLTEQGSGLWFAGVSLSVYEAAGVAGALAGGWMSDKLGRKFVIMVSMIVTPLFMIAFLLVGGWGRFLILPALGFSGLSIAPVIMALVQESYPENRAFANGIYMSLSFTIRSGAAVLAGAIGDLFGLYYAFAVGAVIMLLGVPLIVMLPGGPAGAVETDG